MRRRLLDTRKAAVVKQYDFVSEQDLAEIIERASTVDERPSGDFSPTGGDEALVDERLEAWCLARPDLLPSVLLWE